MDGLKESRSAGRGGDRLARRALTVSAIALGLAAGLFVLWAASEALFVVFAGLLLAVAFDAAAGKVFVEELYVKDRLGGFWEE